MKAKTLMIILVASLAFNIAFIAGYVSNRVKSKPDKRNIQSVMDAGLNLSHDQKNQLEYIIKQFRFDFIQFKQDILEKRMDIIEEFSDPEFKVENLEESLTQLNLLQDQLNQIFMNNLIKICDELDNQQRLQFLMNLGKNWFFVNGSSRGERDGKEK